MRFFVKQGRQEHSTQFFQSLPLGEVQYLFRGLVFRFF